MIRAEIKNSIKLIISDHLTWWNIIYRIRGDTVYLTFDDGPHPHLTPQILRILKKENVKATFFVVGNKVEEYPYLLKNIIDEGHAIGIHSYSHHHFRKASMELFLEDIRKMTDIFERYNIPLPRLYRPPYGEYNIRQTYWLKKNGFKIYMWTFDFISRLENSYNSTADLADNINSGDIVLLHDDEREVPVVLPDIIGSITKRKWKLNKIE